MILVAQSIGSDATIRQNTTFGIARKDALHDRPIIGDRVEIGAGAVIVGPVCIGNGAIIGANAVVTRDVAPGMVVGGIPARVIGRVRKLMRDEHPSDETVAGPLPQQSTILSI
ncbi:serine O-acetyltransferase [Sedimentitalea todarodis]